MQSEMVNYCTQFLACSMYIRIRRYECVHCEYQSTIVNVSANCTHICTYIRTYLHLFQIYVCTYLLFHMYIRIYVYTCVCMSVLYVYMYMLCMQAEIKKEMMAKETVMQQKKMYVRPVMTFPVHFNVGSMLWCRVTVLRVDTLCPGTCAASRKSFL